MKLKKELKMQKKIKNKIIGIIGWDESAYYFLLSLKKHNINFVIYTVKKIPNMFNNYRLNSLKNIFIKSFLIFIFKNKFSKIEIYNLNVIYKKLFYQKKFIELNNDRVKQFNLLKKITKINKFMEIKKVSDQEIINNNWEPPFFITNRFKSDNKRKLLINNLADKKNKTLTKDFLIKNSNSIIEKGINFCEEWIITGYRTKNGKNIYCFFSSVIYRNYNLFISQSNSPSRILIQKGRNILFKIMNKIKIPGNYNVFLFENLIDHFLARKIILGFVPVANHSYKNYLLNQFEYFINDFLLDKKNCRNKRINNFAHMMLFNISKKIGEINTSRDIYFDHFYFKKENNFEKECALFIYRKNYPLMTKCLQSFLPKFLEKKI